MCLAMYCALAHLAHRRLPWALASLETPLKFNASPYYWKLPCPTPLQINPMPRD